MAPGITNRVAEACRRCTVSSSNNTGTLQELMQSTYKYTKSVPCSCSWLGIHKLWSAYSSTSCTACCTVHHLAKMGNTLLKQVCITSGNALQVYLGAAGRRACVCMHAAAQMYPRGMEPGSKITRMLWDNGMRQRVSVRIECCTELSW